VNEWRSTLMLPVGVQLFVAGSYSSAVAVYAPPATSTRPSRRRTASCSTRGWLSVPPGIHVPVGGSYSSVVDSSNPPTTRTRPLSSRVAVKVDRAVAMLAVPVQLPAVVVAVESCVAGRASPSGLELEANAGAASASNAQVADATDFMLMTKPPPRLNERGETRR
jgi:hypothetical protein